MSLLDKASLIVTPNAYKTSKLYSVVPSTGTGDMDVVRATTATRINSLGLIESVGNNIPRIDYTNGSCPSLLVEPQRTNGLYPSEDFLTTWSLFSIATVTANQTTSPSGVQNADKITTTNQNTAIYNPNGAGTSAQTYTVSLFIKYIDNTEFAIGMTDDVTGEAFARFNFTTGTATTTAQGDWTNVSYTWKQLANGWYKISVTATKGASGNARFIAKGGGAYNYFIWGAQVEAGSYSTSYIPTVASTVTRNADVISKTGISSLIGQTEGTLFVEFYNQLVDSTIIFLNKNNTNSVFISSDPLRFGGRVFANGIQYVVFSNNFTIKNQKIKIAFKYSPSGLKLFVNGSLNATNTNTISFTATIDGIFLNDDAIINLNETIYNNGVQLYKTALTDAECIALTTI